MITAKQLRGCAPPFSHAPCGSPAASVFLSLPLPPSLYQTTSTTTETKDTPDAPEAAKKELNKLGPMSRCAIFVILLLFSCYFVIVVWCAEEGTAGLRCVASVVRGVGWLSNCVLSASPKHSIALLAHKPVCCVVVLLLAK